MAMLKGSITGKTKKKIQSTQQQVENQKSKKQKLSELLESKKRFLSLLEKHRNLKDALKEAKISNQTFYKWERSDSLFLKASQLYLLPPQTEKIKIEHLPPATNPMDRSIPEKELLNLDTDDKKRTISRICEGLKVGMGFELSCLYASCNLKTITKMMQDDRSILQLLNEAEGAFVMKCTKKIMESDDWKASSWLLERRFPMLWGEVKQIEHHINDSTKKTLINNSDIIDVKKVIDVKSMSDEELIAAVNEMDND